jgi:dihydroorotate dehydrogenase electron transfer subunit
MSGLNCKVTGQREVSEGIFLLELEAPELALKSRPGHFVHVRTAEGWDPLWRRPFSIHRVSEDKKSVRLLYRKVGKGTSRMQAFKTGDVVNLLGPLGTPFDIEGGFGTAVVAAGGLGIAPVFFLADRLAGAGIKTVLFWGVRHSGELVGADELTALGVEIHTATEDGSAGFRGRVTELLKENLSRAAAAPDPRGFACGPMPMLKTMQALVPKTGFRWQASLEEKMACGAGVCQGCAVRMRSGGYRMVCADGPVFDLMELEFNG